jgi:hypothetical protein
MWQRNKSEDERNLKNYYFCHLSLKAGLDNLLCAFSSVGLEHYLDRVGVTGSNPVRHTT